MYKFWKEPWQTPLDHKDDLFQAQLEVPSPVNFRLIGVNVTEIVGNHKKIRGKTQESHWKMYSNNKYGDFWAKYVMKLFKNRFNSFIDSSASDWPNKVPISSF